MEVCCFVSCVCFPKYFRVSLIFQYVISGCTIVPRKIDVLFILIVSMKI
jgi:hypothetical protein